MGDVLAPAGRSPPPRLIEGPCRQSLGIPSRATMLAGKSLRHARLPAGVPAPVGKAPLRRAPNSSGREGREAPQSGVLIRDFITRWYVCRKVWKFVKAVAAAGRGEAAGALAPTAWRGNDREILAVFFSSVAVGTALWRPSWKQALGGGNAREFFAGVAPSGARFPVRPAVFGDTAL